MECTYLFKMSRLLGRFKPGGLIMMLLFAWQVGFAQSVTVTGTVTDETGFGLPGATVLIQGTSNGTVTEVDGTYSLSAQKGQTLQFSYTGYQTQSVVVGDNTVINISMSPDVSLLDEIVVTGYSSEKKADIIGSVSVISTEDMKTTPAANLTSQLQGRAGGVVVSGSGEPGSSSKVRIRGFTSFGSSSPLYVIDGVPTGDASKVNPQDIESIQVLKDATSASIYGARAAQGVIIITTKQGKAGTLRLSYDGYVGTQTFPYNRAPDLLNTADYVKYLQKNNGTDFTHPVFGNLANPVIPDYIVVSNGFKGGVKAGDPRANPDLYSIENYRDIYQIMALSDGTDWFREATQSGFMQSHQVTASGGTDKAVYSLGFNYFDQEGTLKYSGYKRYAVRANTSFSPKKYLRLGENVQVLYESFAAGGTGNRTEGSAFAQMFRMVPYIPVYDINGGWGGNGVGESGNGSNPLANVYRQKDNLSYNYKIFGNVFAEVTPVKNLTLRTSYGIDYGNNNYKNYTWQTYERSENVGLTQLGQGSTYNLFWTWTNTATYELPLGDHNVKILAGTEAIKGFGDGITVSSNTFDFEDPEFVTLNTDQAVNDVSSPLFRQTLASVFGKIDYSYQGKYLFNATVRRDGSSKFGSDNRYGVFPAFGVGWRISQEGFMDNVSFIDDLKLRGGWGQLGSERVVDANNQYSIFFFNVGATNYDINRQQTGTAQGYAAQRAGSSATKWETSETTNIGFDASLFNYKVDFSFNWFNNDTKDLLVQRVRNGLEPLTIQPYINIGKMRNRGFDFNATYHGGGKSEFKWDATLTFTHYKNTVIDIDGNPETFFSSGTSRFGNAFRTQAGHPISSFVGFEIDGFFETQADLEALDQPNAVIGSWRFKDQNGDGVINDDDRTFIGSPHPDFVAGLNLGAHYRNWDLNSFFVWNYGNELYNYTKNFYEMRYFVGGVGRRVLEDGWEPGKSDAALPKLAPGTESGYTELIRNSSMDYYVESGSYFRAKTVQLGYTLPQNVVDRMQLGSIRLYVQAQNLFTITPYTGVEPDITINGTDTSNDLRMGYDETSYPQSKQFLFGLNVSF
ncbi:MAG: TonB-dependent receptor [Lewinellaceae bacterium]|nr:TonB-dependent receptor [Saprospiraceae bacterium]MCB9272228.1 TonB-dependent receptor [Lewinellaceae bacterium]HPG07336.1 TonB-dependent receptor [Saprospiraceae bacterium]HQU51569.1 TonB-dependent receptor [Saprospiraceae bacterium]